MASWLVAGVASADALPDHSNGPLTGLFGFPASVDGANTLAARTHGFALSVGTASHNIDEQRGSESLRLDGESTRLAVAWRYGVSDRLELGIEVPWRWHQSGSFDGFINGWHDFFGLPEGPRATRVDDRLELFYSDAQSSLIRLTGNTSGIGDVRLQAAWRLAGNVHRRTALRASVKVPTGDSAKLHGSGGTDLSVGIAGDADVLWGRDWLSGFYRADLTSLGEPDLLPDRANDLVGQLSGGVGFRVHRNVDLRVQARIRSAVYESDIGSLGEPSATLTAGANFRLSDRYRLSLAVGEDVKPDSAPDVSFQLALRYRGQ